MERSFVIFGHRNARFGLDAGVVSEIVWLPELSPIEELAPYFAGVFNLRGRVVPVMDLGLRFGHAREPFLTSDRVIVIARNQARVGVVANELHDVVSVRQEAIEDARSYQGSGGHAHFVQGEAKLDDGLVMLLDVDALLRSTPHEEALLNAPPGPAGAGGSGVRSCVDTNASIQDLTPSLMPSLSRTLSPEQAEVFRDRARSLARVPQTEERSGLEGFAVIRLDGELFGLGLDTVREFSHLRGVTPLPCCPPHIAGNMNLRGDILTLVDIRPALGMAITGAMREVVVVRIGELRLGLPAAEIVDVVHLKASEIAAVPAASGRAGSAYCKGVATVGGRAVGILDLEKLLSAREMQVAEQVQ